jgi:tape measure domain-containing protein
VADQTEALILQMSADLKRMEKQFTKALAEANNTATGIEKRFDGMSLNVGKSAESMGKFVTRSLAAMGLSLGAREVINYANAWQTATNKLAAVGVPAAQLADTQDRLVRLSLQTRTSLSDTVDLYTRLTRSTQQFGITQDQVFRGTEIINQAFKVGGASAQEQAAAIQQLGQALSSGTLQGDELRSIRENAPLLAKAIADEFGVTIGQLKQLGSEGKITTDKIFDGILAAGKAIGDQFKSTQATLQDATINLGTAIEAQIGRLDRMYGISAAIANKLQEGADALNNGKPGDQPKTPVALIARGKRDEADITRAFAETDEVLERKNEAGAVRDLDGAEAKLAANRKKAAVDRINDLNAELQKMRDYTRAVIAAQQEEQKQPLRQILEPPNVKYARSSNIKVLQDVLKNIEKQRSVVTDRLADLIKAPASIFLDDGNSTNPLTQVDKLKTYETALEAFNATLKEIGASQESSANKSRAAEQAVLSYVSATKDIAGAYALIPSLKDVLTGEDTADLKQQLSAQAAAALAAVATGADKVEAEFKEAMERTEAAHKAAVAAGIDDLAAYGRAVDAIFAKRADDLFALGKGSSFREVFKDLLTPPSAEELGNHLPTFEVYGEEFRKATKEGLSRGLKEGIETDNWGNAIRDVLADSITAALDKSLDQLASVLTDIVLGNGNKNSGLINWAASFFTGGGPRASGGPRSAYSMGTVNETGKGEFLFMGNNPGQVLTAAQVNGLVTGGARGGVSISSPLIVQGSLTEEVLPKVQKMMAENNQKLMQVVPHMIDGRTIENARYRRYGGKR